MNFKNATVVLVITMFGVIYGNAVFIVGAMGLGLNQTWVAGVSGYVAGAWITAGVLWVKK